MSSKQSPDGWHLSTYPKHNTPIAGKCQNGWRMTIDNSRAAAAGLSPNQEPFVAVWIDVSGVGMVVFRRLIFRGKTPE